MKKLKILGIFSTIGAYVGDYNSEDLSAIAIDVAGTGGVEFKSYISIVTLSIVGLIVLGLIARGSNLIGKISGTE